MRNPREDVNLAQPPDIPEQERASIIRDAQERIKEARTIIKSLESV